MIWATKKVCKKIHPKTGHHRHRTNGSLIGYPPTLSISLSLRFHSAKKAQLPEISSLRSVDRMATATEIKPRDIALWGRSVEGNDTSFAAGLWRRRIRRGCPKLVSLEEIKLKIHFFARRFRGKRRRERCHSALFLFYSIMFKMTARACPRCTPNTIRYGIVCFGIASFIKKYFASFCTKNAQLFFCDILL